MADDETEWHLDDLEMARLDIVYGTVYRGTCSQYIGSSSLIVFASCLRTSREIRLRAVFRILMMVEVGSNEFHILRGVVPFPLQLKIFLSSSSKK